MTTKEPDQPNYSGEVIPCSLSAERKKLFAEYAEDLRAAAHTLGSHGLQREEFWNSGLFHGAIEHLRGQQAARGSTKREFLVEVLSFMQQKAAISSFAFTGAGERHDYQIAMPTGRMVIFEAKGCLDGNNTNIFQRPANADEFLIWSLCQNKGADPRHNAWSGIHTRLGAAILAEKQRVDALVIWDMLCGTLFRICPKLSEPGRAIQLPSGRQVPPPCIYLFPRTTPDARNNTNPDVWKLEELSFLHAMARAFGCESKEIFEVHIQTRMKQANVQRRTTLVRAGRIVQESRWTTLKRASR